MHPDHLGYYAFTGRSRLDKAINSLLGIVEGISVDAKINKTEIAFLTNWLDAHQPYRDRHPFNEFLPVVSNAVADGLLTRISGRISSGCAKSCVRQTTMMRSLLIFSDFTRSWGGSLPMES